MRVVFSRLQNCADFSDGDFRDGGSAFQHMGTVTARAREPYVTVLVRGKSSHSLLMTYLHIRWLYPEQRECVHCARSVNGIRSMTVHLNNFGLTPINCRRLCDTGDDDDEIAYFNVR